MLSLLDNALLQALSYGIATLGIALALRIVRYPDLTADGSFVLGAAVCGAVLLETGSWPVAVLASVAAGGVAGLLTGTIHQVARVSRILSGILTSMMCYSLAFRTLSNRPNRSIAGIGTPYDFAASLDRRGWGVEWGLHPASLLIGSTVTGLVVAIVWWALRSEWGLVLRATGSNASVIRSYGRKPDRYVLSGLIMANGLVALSASLVVTRQDFVDINMGVGILILLIAALVVGEQILGRIAPALAAHPLLGPLAGALVGTFLYYLFYLAILRASVRGWLPVQVQPTDLKLLSALVVIAVILLRSRSARTESEQPVVL